MNELPRSLSPEAHSVTENLHELSDEQLQVTIDNFIDRSHEYGEEDLYTELYRYIQEIDRRALPNEHPLSQWRRASAPHLNRINPEVDAEIIAGGRYGTLLEAAYQRGDSLHLPELEVFGANEVNIESIREFAIELVDFIEKKEREADEEEMEYLYRFGQGIHSEFFSASPNLVNFIQLSDRLRIMAHATRSKVIQGTFGSVLVGETVYDVSFMDSRLDETTQQAMEDLSVSEKLDLLHQLRTVGAQAIANGEWSRPAYNQVRQTYETLTKSEDSAVFVQLAAEAGLETLDTEYENPQLGVIRFEGQTSDSRLNTRFSNEHVEAITDKFFSKYSLDHVVSNATKVLPATKDALVCLDRSGLATGIIRLDVEQFLESPKNDLNFDINQYRIYKQHLDAAEEFPAQRRDEVSVKIYHAIYKEYVEEFVDTGDAESAARVFAEILPLLSEEEWKTYFIGEITQREYPSQNELYVEAGNENEQASHEFVLGLFDYRDQLSERYEEDYLELEAALEHEDFEHAFEVAANISLKAGCEWREYEKWTNLDIAAEIAPLEEKRLKAMKFAEIYDDAEGVRVTKGYGKVAEKLREEIDHITQTFSYYTSFPEEKVLSIFSAANATNKLREAHQANFKAARQKFETAMTELKQTEEIRAQAEIISKIEDSLGELGDELHALIEGKLDTAKELPQLELITLRELVAELKGNESMERIADEDVLLFQHVHSGELASKIEGEFGFALSDLSVREQYFFLNYLKRVTPQTAEVMKQFTSLYGVNGMRTFLSLERGDESLGDHIVAFGQHDEVAGTVFKYYGELLDSAEHADAILNELTKGNYTEEDVVAFRENILKRAQKDLEEAVQAHDPGEVAATIEYYVAEAKEYVAFLQEVGGKTEIITAAELTPEDKAAMQALQRQRYEAMYPGEEYEEFRNDVFAALAESFERNDVVFNILIHDNVIVCFNRFETKVGAADTEVTHFGSFNAHPAYSGAGGYMLRITIQERLTDGRPMMAECDPNQKISEKYVNDGFIATSLIDDYAGHPDLKIWRSQDSDTLLRSKQLSPEELLDLRDDATERAEIVVRERAVVEDFPEFQDGKGLTRVLHHDGATWLVFETLPDELKDEFTFVAEQSETD